MVMYSIFLPDYDDSGVVMMGLLKIVAQGKVLPCNT